MTTSPLDQAACLALAQRQVGDPADWSPDDWTAQLAEDAVQRGDPPQTYYRPYRTALAYLSRPGLIKARSEGDVSEQYADPALTISRLERLDAEWEADVLPAKAAADSGEWSGAIEWGSW